jgi:hypothetical protein
VEVIHIVPLVICTHKFGENRFSETQTAVKRVNKILSTSSTFFFLFGSNSVQDIFAHIYSFSVLQKSVWWMFHFAYGCKGIHFHIHMHIFYIFVRF